MIKLNVEPKNFIDLYLFGSSIYSENNSDIDIAIIYEKDKISIDEVIKYRKDLEKSLIEISGYSIDTILLSKEEEKEMEFLFNAKHEKI